MRVCYYPANIDAAGWYRCLFPSHYLRELGHTATHPPMTFSREGKPLPLANGQLPDGYVQIGYEQVPDADIYVLQMPTGPNQPDFVKHLQSKGKKVVVEADDDYTCIPGYNPFDKDLHGGPGSGSQFLLKCIQLADAVTVSTPSLKRSYKHLNRRIGVLRNRLCWTMWQDITPVYEQTWERVRVGYMGLLPFHSADLAVIRPWFSKWIKARPEVEFVAAGDQRVHDYLGVPVSQRVGTDSVDFRHLELANVTAVMDIGLVPLARNRFNEGKSYLKGLEYSACGIVPVCTPTAQYRELLASGTGVLADKPSEWRDALDKLVSARAAIRRLGMEARRLAQTWTYERHIAEWESFYLDLLDGDPDVLWAAGDGDNTVVGDQERVAA